MSYFTIWHIAVLICAILIFILILLLMYLNKDKIKNFYVLIGLTLLIISMGSYTIMISLDDKLKTAVISDVSTQRVYINETIVFKGNIRNTSKYNLSRCDIYIQMNSSPGKLQDFSRHLTKKNDFFSFLYKNETEDLKPVKSNVSVNNIKPFEIRSFSAVLSFPPNFTDPKFFYKVDCK
ncbi:DNA gyrase subunit B [Campylobacter sputorum subsp. bubulus]|nr:DUF2393 family protein [Campylobacter sputorum]ASM34540.1 DUF2393 domain protein [Campylobacter sputorum aubsp. sputorum RM3237]SUX09635.1 DNA gyrase subunit B [Campylobacter sputorum subsp. bubulus]